jgi:plastocyanin
MRAPLTLNLLAAFAATSLFAAGCGEDDGGSAAAAPASGDTAGETIEIVGVDYGYEDVPDQVSPGASITLKNASDTEVHEIVALRIDDDEARPLDELLRLGRADQEQVTEVRGVTVAFPGETGQFPAPSITLDQPGRYVLACFIPTGADPDAYREAARTHTGEGPVPVDGGPPHVVQGMAAEIVVG